MLSFFHNYFLVFYTFCIKSTRNIVVVVVVVVVVVFSAPSGDLFYFKLTATTGLQSTYNSVGPQ